MSYRKACREILERLHQAENPDGQVINRLKIEAARRYRLQSLPSNAQLLREAGEDVYASKLLRRKQVRSLSGVIVIAAMTQPYPCPHGRCAYCPGGPGEGVPQSYTGREPAALRGLQHNFDPRGQVESRIRQLQEIGHIVDKVELIIMGGTFQAMPEGYQEAFIKGCLDGLNGRGSPNLDAAMRLAGDARVRNVGITVETRPDWCRQRHVERMLRMGVTRVELGVQTVYDDVYRLVERGHSVEDVVEATRVLKDSGLKVCYHMMPMLPGSDGNRDVEAFRRIFSDPGFKPDMVKIYPTLVLKGTKVYDWWLRGDYKPPTTEEAAALIAKVKGLVPPWVRVMRVQRDIPAQLIVAGVDKSNLRELVHVHMRSQGVRCRCIRCREVGHRKLRGEAVPTSESFCLHTQTYPASEGLEVFLSVEDPESGILFGYLRLRVPSVKAFRPEIAGMEAALIRQLHVVGPLVPLSSRSAEAWQHRGFGALLIAEAERVALEGYGLRKMLVTAALGTKAYYTRFGYVHDGVYMSKRLR